MLYYVNIFKAFEQLPDVFTLDTFLVDDNLLQERFTRSSFFNDSEVLPRHVRSRGVKRIVRAAPYHLILAAGRAAGVDLFMTGESLIMKKRTELTFATAGLSRQNNYFYNLLSFLEPTSRTRLAAGL